MTLIISCCKEKLSESEFVQPLLHLIGDARVVHYTKVKQTDIAGAGKIIIAGTALKDFAYLEGDWSWLKSCTIPVLGICAGAQVIAKAFGAELVKKTAIGVRPIRIIKENPLLEQDTQGYFLYSLEPKGKLDTLAESLGSPCILQVPKRPIFLCTFHPEVMTELIIRAFVSQRI